MLTGEELRAELADRMGFSTAWAAEHDFLTEFAHSSAPEVFLAAVAQRTRRIRVGHAVRRLPYPFNHPIRVAERIAALDIVSNGRVEFGTGRSSAYEQQGFEVPALADARPVGAFVNDQTSVFTVVHCAESQADAIANFGTEAAVDYLSYAFKVFTGGLEKEAASGTPWNIRGRSTSFVTSGTPLRAARRPPRWGVSPKFRTRWNVPAGHPAKAWRRARAASSTASPARSMRAVIPKKPWNMPS